MFGLHHPKNYLKKNWQHVLAETHLQSAKERVSQRDDKFSKLTKVGEAAPAHINNSWMWRTKSLSISLDFQKQVSHQHKRLSVPTGSKTQTQNAPRELSVGPRAGRLNIFLMTHAHGTKAGTITRWLTWHNVTDGDKSSVFQTGKITQQLPINHTIPVPDRIVL